LARYAASEAALRRVLNARIERTVRLDPDFAADLDRRRDLIAAIETLVERHRKSGALNDAAFAEMKVRSLRQRGRSRRLIAQTLAAQGIDGGIVTQALVAFDEDRPPDAAEFDAADALARRRKLGPYRKVPPADKDAAQKARQKEFAVLARAGFSGAIIRRVLGRSAADLDAEPDMPDDWD
jgi:regulatory protein